MVRIAVVDRTTGIVRAVIAPDVQLSPFVAQEGEALVLVPSTLAEVPSLSLVSDYQFDLSTQQFVPKEAP